MAKLRIEDLKVDSFATTTFPQRTGTVGAYETGGLEYTCWGGCIQNSDPDTCGGGGQPTWATCPGQASCPKTACGPTCGPTMAPTCHSCPPSGCMTCDGTC